MRLRADTKSLACARTSQILAKPFVPLNAALALKVSNEIYINRFTFVVVY